MAMIMRFFSFPPLHPADAEPLAPQPKNLPIPKAFPKWWGALRLLQLWAGTLVILSSIFTIKSSKGHHGQEPSTHDEAHGHHVTCALFGAACLSFMYIVTTVILRAKHPVGFAKCVPFVFAGDVFMMGLFGFIKLWAARVLKLAKHGGMMKVFKRWVKKGCKHAGKMGKGQWGKDGDWKGWLNEFKHGSNGETDEVRRKTKMMGLCALKMVRKMAGVATILFFLSSLVALYIMFTHRGQIKKHICEVRESLRECCRARRMRRCARRAARRAGKCCDRKCAQSEFYPDEKKASGGICSMDIPVTLPVVVDSFPAGILYVPGAFPPPPPPPTQAPSPSPQLPLSGAVTPYEYITPTLSAIQTPISSSGSAVGSVTLAGVHGDVESSTDDEFTHVGYRHVRTPSTSSGSELGVEEEGKPLL